MSNRTCWFSVTCMTSRSAFTPCVLVTLSSKKFYTLFLKSNISSSQGFHVNCMNDCKDNLHVHMVQQCNWKMCIFQLTTYLFLFAERPSSSQLDRRKTYDFSSRYRKYRWLLRAKKGFRGRQTSRKPWTRVFSLLLGLLTLPKLSSERSPWSN